MDFNSIVFLFLGSTYGLTLRMFLNYNFQIKAGININNTSLVNFLASFFLGIFVALNITNKNLLLFSYVGFLGCFSTFSSFIYQLFILLRKKEFLALILHYFEVLIFSFLFFYVGYYLIQIFKQ